MTRTKNNAKFMPVHSGSSLVRRRRPLRTLVSCEDRRLTLVIAPAGFGKTSLMAQRYNDLKSEGVRPAWVDLESNDHDPGHFLSNLLDSLETAGRSKDGGRDHGALSMRQLLGVVKTRIGAAPEPVHLFLDDYHLAQCDANDSIIAALLHSDSGRNLRLSIISRSEPRFPMSQLRLDGQLTYMNAADLRFTLAEAESLFAFANVNLDRNRVERLVEKTEGWAVALQMVRALLRDGIFSSDTLLDFSGTQQDMARYLSEQVVSALPDRLCSLLIRMSPLPEFSADLAVEVTGEADAARLVETLGQYGLPIEAVDHDIHQVRLHAVFREFLLREAQKAGISPAATLTAAARWHRARGEWNAAIRLALLADDTELAAAIAESGGGWRFVYVGSRGLSYQFRTLAGRLPDAKAAELPKTFMGLSVVSAKAGNLDLAVHYIELVERALDRTDPTLVSEFRLISALIALYRDRRMDGVELSLLERDLASLNLVEPIQRALTCNLLCFQYLERGKLQRAQRYGANAIQTFSQAGALFGALHLYVHLGQAHYFAGDMDGAVSAYETLVSEAQRTIGKGSDLDAMGQALIAELLAERGLYDDADRILDWALPHLERNDCWFDLLAAAYLTRIRGRLVAGDFAAVHGVLDQAYAIAKRRRFDRLERLVARERMRAIVLSGDLAGARRFAEQNDLGPASAIDSGRNVLGLRLRGEVPATLWARLWAREGDTARALTLLERLETAQEQQPSVPRRIRLGILKVLAHFHGGDAPAAAACLDGLVLTSWPTGYRAAFFEEGEALVSLLRERASAARAGELVAQRIGAILAPDDPAKITVSPGVGQSPPQASPVRLTEKEMSVFALLRVGLSNKDIARGLDLSVNTVKFHLRNIYGKLNVRSRTGALSAAREMGLMKF